MVSYTVGNLIGMFILGVMIGFIATLTIIDLRKKKEVCQHDWTRWSKPYSHGHGGLTEAFSGLQTAQKRRCKVCNLYQIKYITPRHTAEGLKENDD